MPRKSELIFKRLELNEVIIDIDFQGPVFPEPLNTPADLSKLNRDDPVSRLLYVGQALTRMRHLLEGKVPLFGFTGAPVGFLSSLKKCFRNYEKFS